MEINEFKGRICGRDEGFLQVRIVMWLGYCDCTPALKQVIAAKYLLRKDIKYRQGKEQ